MTSLAWLATGLCVGLFIGGALLVDQMATHRDERRELARFRAEAARRAALDAETYREGPPCHHLRDGVVMVLGALYYRCLDCGRTRELGPVFPSAYCHRRTA